MKGSTSGRKAILFSSAITAIFSAYIEDDKLSKPEIDTLHSLLLKGAKTGGISMADFGIRFFLCNILICIIIGILLMTKQVLRNHLTSRMQFHLWFLLLGLLAVPFLPVRPVQFSQIFLLLDKLKNTATTNIETITETAVNVSASGTAKQINDFVLSVSSKTPSIIGLILFGIWLIGILAMLLLAVKSRTRLNALKKSSLPLQNMEIRMLYNNCLSEMKIKRNIPIYSTAFLKSPIIAGLFRPCIYLPIHLISDLNASDMRYTHRAPHNSYLSGTDGLRPIRYMLLHELQHYRHRDAIAGCLMNLIGVLYWFNPLVWYALKEMQGDREVACDTSVLKLLNESDYEDYGNTLIDFAEKVSLMPFPFAAGISGTMKQMQKRIINISTYKKPSVWKIIKGAGIFALIGAILLGVTPILSTYEAEQNYYKWNISPEKIDLIDLSAYFNGYEGSFVLYDLKNDAWSIYDMNHATLRTSPNSTYKIYDALFGLEEGIITPKDSFMAWNGTDYPFEAWNANQDLYSAMQSSVNWYFQEIDGQLGASAIQNFITKIGYGNENINSDLSLLLTNGTRAPEGIEGYPEGVSSFWMQSTLKISPVEQVKLLTDLHSNSFGFIPENVKTVKDSICLFSSDDKSFYGKTGTGRVDGQDVNGWFVGFVENDGNTYFFATNIQNDTNATGSNAAEITKSILSDLNVWQSHTASTS